MIEQWEKITLEEQETIINFDYYAKLVDIYTSRAIVYKNLLKNIGKPNHLNINNNQIYGAEWKIPFNERKKIRTALAVGNLLMVKTR